MQTVNCICRRKYIYILDVPSNYSLLKTFIARENSILFSLREAPSLLSRLSESHVRRDDLLADYQFFEVVQLQLSLAAHIMNVSGRRLIIFHSLTEIYRYNMETQNVN